MRWTRNVVASAVVVIVSACGGPSADRLAALDTACSSAYAAHDDSATLSACRDAARAHRDAAARASTDAEREQNQRAEDSAERTLLRETFRLQASGSRDARNAANASDLDAASRVTIARDVAKAGHELALDVATSLARDAVEPGVRAYAAQRRVEIQHDLLAVDPTWTPPQ